VSTLHFFICGLDTRQAACLTRHVNEILPVALCEAKLEIINGKGKDQIAGAFPIECSYRSILAVNVSDATVGEKSKPEGERTTREAFEELKKDRKVMRYVI